MPIIFDEKRKIFKLDTPGSTYAIKIFEGGYLLHLYYGKKLNDTNLDFMIPSTIDVSYSPRAKSVLSDPDFSTDIKPMEYSVNGTGDYRVSALQIRAACGNAATDIRYKSHKIYDLQIFSPNL